MHKSNDFCISIGYAAEFRQDSVSAFELAILESILPELLEELKYAGDGTVTDNKE